MPEINLDGVVLVDKPSGWTSHDVVARVRRIAGTKRVGHLGTLDPMATGLLPLIVNRATRLAQFYTHSEKEYEGTIRLGFSTDTYDAEGEPTSLAVSGVSFERDAIEQALEAFRGSILQTPPPVSAKKVNGVRAYKIARKKEDPGLKAVEVKVFRLEVTGIDGPDVSIAVHCSSGTYIRSIAHDLGQRLGCGGHLAALRRTRVAAFSILEARTLDALAELAAGAGLLDALIPMASMLPEIPAERVDPETALRIRQGRDFQANPFRQQDGPPLLKALSEDGTLVAIGKRKLASMYHPFLVL